MNKPASTYVIIAHFTESGDFFPKKGGGEHQGTFPSVSHGRCFLKSKSLNNENSSPKNTHIQSSFFARAFKSSPKSHRSKYKQNIRPKRMTWKIPHHPCWQNKMALNSWRRYKQRSRFEGRWTERKRWENSGKVKQMALAFDFPDGCPDWWAQWHRVISLTCCLHCLPIRRSLSLSLVSQTLRPGTTRQPGHSGFSLLLLFIPYR